MGRDVVVVSYQYRFLLIRRINQPLMASAANPVGLVTFVMLNPSTADAEQDDPTIRRCIGFVRDWGYGWLHVVNLLPVRATDPRELKYIGMVPPEVERANRSVIQTSCRAADRVVLAWGENARTNASVRAEASYTIQQLENADVELFCLDTTNSGAPRHPLYTAKASILKQYTNPA